MLINFTPTNTSYHNIKLICNIFENNKAQIKEYLKFEYNNRLYFLYKFKVINDSLEVNIITRYTNTNKFEKNYIGSFIYDTAIKFSASKIEINFKNYSNYNCVVSEFLQKDFLYNKYLSKSKSCTYKTTFKLDSDYRNIMNSLDLLKMLVSEPSNIIYPDTFSKILNKKINKKNVIIKNLNKSQIKKAGLKCLLAVNQGSSKEPRVVEFKSIRNKRKEVDILFVGKGVCFDSGGISIKPSSGMEDMKWDMAGAAVVGSIINYLSNRKNNFSYAGIIGLVENMPSGTAYKPGDIINSYKGINVEVLNTDAEGRLVLADIIAYGCDVYKPKMIIDFATLTGAIMVALGQHYAGLYSNDDKLAEMLYDSGVRTNEKVWRMPLHEDFDKELNSPFVDVRNITNSRYGGSVTAAQFLQRFVPKNTKWAHLDIAGVTWKPNGDKMNNKGATGFGLTLIADFIDKYF